VTSASPSTRPTSAAATLIERLRQFGVSTVFGYPGGPLTPLYDALYHEPSIRHILARDEQGAGFMADGYARATGKPGVCLAVCGPGVFNAITPLATAFSDSIPVLLISGQLPSRDVRSGYYHENDQLRVCEPVTKAQFRVEDARQVVPELDRAWQALTTGRPGPVLIEVPGDVLRAEHPALELPPLPAPPPPLQPSPADVQAAAQIIKSWKRPLILAGGGVIHAGAMTELRALAECLGSPVFHTLMGKSAIPGDHPLAAGLPWKEGTSDACDMASRMSPILQDADGLLAIGCRFTQVTTGSWAMPVPKSLVQIDIDPTEFGRHHPCELAILGDARLTARELLQSLPASPREPWTNAQPPRPTWTVAGLDLASALRRALPRETIVVADVTRLAYVMLVEFPAYEPRTFLHPAAAVSMGYGLPAALGARAAFSDRPVVAVMGDGCFQMTGMELATAAQEQLPIVLVVINDGSLTLIKALQHKKYGSRFLGVDLRNPDFGLLAKAFGVRHLTANDAASLEAAVKGALGFGETVLVEMRIPR
jgi:acetolactate synthase-1/2/3 large subunit